MQWFLKSDPPKASPMAAMKSSALNSIWFLVFLFLCVGDPASFIAGAASTIGPGDEFNSTGPLVSDNGNFTMGFFTIDATGYSYLGIWYNNDNRDGRVWVANRYSPIVDGPGVFRYGRDGTLAIFVGENRRANVSDQRGSGNSTARLENSGNFVLFDEVENRVIWQSFDHPGARLLTGARLGFNRTTRQNWTLKSWLSDSFPAFGAFRLSLESGQLLIRRRGQPYWNSGPWNNQTQNFRFTTALTDPANRNHYNLSYESTTDGEFFAFRSATETGRDLISLQLSPRGHIIDDGNTDRNVAPIDEFCYGYETDGGCVSSDLPDCRRSGDRFEDRNGDFVDADVVNVNNSSISIADCMERCWNDCGCVGFTTGGNGTGCVLWRGRNEFRVNVRGPSVSKYVLLSQRPSRENTWIWIVIAVSIFLVLLILGSFCYMRIRKHRLADHERKRSEEYLHQLTVSESFNDPNGVGNEGNDLKFFSFGSIMAATNNFSSENKLGEGGFGPVYKGRFVEGREIAVKRLSRTSRQGLVEFKNELILIAKLQHTNLVRVLGCCIHAEEKMLIYEYVPNKSLDYYLFDQAKSKLLNWEKRLDIIEGVAQGLAYLHKYSRMRVIHRDLKASNVLLDENMNPKISDFGMARIFKPNETKGITKRVVGTYGYMSPEYAMEGTFSVKSDVFSFGVLVLEIVSGRRNSSFYDPDRPLNLIGYAWDLWKEGVAIELKDSTMRDTVDEKQVLRTIHVGLLCVQEHADDRPTISEVISMLTNETLVLPMPKKLAFFTGSTPEILLSSSEGKLKKCSINDMSLSIMEAR